MLFIIESENSRAEVLYRSDGDFDSEVLLSDAGTYICNATDVNSGLNSAVEIDITVLGMEDCLYEIVFSDMNCFFFL